MTGAYSKKIKNPRLKAGETQKRLAIFRVHKRLVFASADDHEQDEEDEDDQEQLVVENAAHSAPSFRENLEYYMVASLFMLVRLSYTKKIGRNR
ncbi:hypothetical protein BSNK01_06370 [Bacillaceae bacterium]